MRAYVIVTKTYEVEITGEFDAEGNQDAAVEEWAKGNGIYVSTDDVTVDF